MADPNELSREDIGGRQGEPAKSGRSSTGHQLWTDYSRFKRTCFAIRFQAGAERVTVSGDTQ